MSTNQQLAAVFQQMADLMQILGQDSFRINAFQRAARSLDDLSQDVAAIGADAKKLAELPGIGKGMAQRIDEFLRTGRIDEHRKLLSQVPAGLLELLNISGLGPKTLALFWTRAGVENLEQLKAKLAGDELTKLPGMGPKKIENLRKNVALAAEAGRRFRIGQVMPLARWIVGRLGTLEGVREAAYAGSLRRGRETLGDLDILVAAEASDAARISAAFIQLEPVAAVVARGDTKTTVRTGEHLQIDLRVVPRESFGAALIYFTGSREHNVRLRQRAIDRGWKLNEYGLFDGETRLAGATEQEVFKALGLAWIAPELREDRDEIALAEAGKLPALVELSDIKADLHTHTIASDGKWSIRDLAAAGIDRGFHSLAITDHSVSQVIANGLSVQRLEEHVQQVRAVAEKVKDRIRLLVGAEVDILADGRLDYPNSVLKELDIVIASPHAALSQEPRLATTRLLKAIANPYVTILGHPTGRLIGRRAGLAPDMSQVIGAAAQRGIALEINANHYRLDLRDTHARAALEAGVMLAINTDAHGPADLDELLYGVLTARRAGAEPRHIVNCLSATKLAQWIKSTRG